MSSGEEDGDDGLPSRSRTTRWRRDGPKRRRFEQFENDLPPQFGDDVVPQEEPPGDNVASPRSEDPREGGDESDSDWSADLRDHGDQTSDEEIDPVVAAEDEDLIIEDGDDLNLSPNSSASSDSPAFSLAQLDQPMEFKTPRTVKESLLLDLSLSVRHKLNYECLIQMLQNKNFLFGYNYFPSNKRKLFKILQSEGSGVVPHVYCSQCDYLIGKKKDLDDIVECPVCHLQKRKSETSFFVSLNVKRQLRPFLSLPGVPALLRYRENRCKKKENAIEDIFDGEEYKKIEVDGKKLMNSDNYTYVFNTDGCKARKGGKLSIYPLFLRLNELPPQLRQKFVFLAAVFVDSKEPNMMSFLQPFVTSMNDLAVRGISWVRDGEQVVSKFLPTCFCVDGKARAQILNMTTHAGHCACVYCTYHGVYINGTMRYPVQHPELPPVLPRSHERILIDMGNCTNGFKGPTPLALLKGLNLVTGAASDDLHYFYECASLQLTELLLTQVQRVDENMSDKTFLDTIDSRLKSIATPSSIARKPGTCLMKNRKQMKGTEWRNWLLYYGPICLQNLIPGRFIHHLEQLSYATFLLSQDIITSDEIDTAERLIQEFLVQYDQFFGIENTRLNLHSLRHAPDSVRNWGGLWCYTTFNFESWNHKIMQLVTSPKGALQQIVTRHLIQYALQTTIFTDNEISPDVVNQIREILNKKRHVNAKKYNNHIYLVRSLGERNPSEEELQVLHREELNTAKICVYKKILIRSVEFISSGNQEESRSDNSSIFTYQNTFCTIQSIVSFTTDEGQEMCGLFVLEHQVTRRDRPIFPHAKHIVEIRGDDTDLLHFIEADNVRSPVVKATVLGNKFFIPLPNSYEID